MVLVFCSSPRGQKDNHMVWESWNILQKSFMIDSCKVLKYAPEYIYIYIYPSKLRKEILKSFNNASLINLEQVFANG